MSAPNGNGHRNLIGACTLILGIVGLVGGLILSSQSKTDEKQGQDLATTIQEVKELREFKAWADATIKSQGKDIDLSREERKAAATIVVPRLELEQKWVSNATNFVNLQRQIDDLRKDFSQIYSPTQVLTEIQERVKRLEQIRLNNSIGKAE